MMKDKHPQKIVHISIIRIQKASVGKWSAYYLTTYPYVKKSILFYTSKFYEKSRYDIFMIPWFLMEHANYIIHIRIYL